MSDLEHALHERIRTLRAAKEAYAALQEAAQTLFAAIQAAQQAGCSTSLLGLQLGVSKATISRWYRGESVPNVSRFAHPNKGKNNA